MVHPQPPLKTAHLIFTSLFHHLLSQAIVIMATRVHPERMKYILWGDPFVGWKFISIEIVCMLPYSIRTRPPRQNVVSSWWLLFNYFWYFEHTQWVYHEWCERFNRGVKYSIKCICWVEMKKKKGLKHWDATCCFSMLQTHSILTIFLFPKKFSLYCCFFFSSTSFCYQLMLSLGNWRRILFLSFNSWVILQLKTFLTT